MATPPVLIRADARVALPVGLVRQASFAAPRTAPATPQLTRASTFAAVPTMGQLIRDDIFDAPRVLTRADTFAASAKAELTQTPRSDSWPGASPAQVSQRSVQSCIAPGDVLIVRGQGRLVDVGTNGGLLGHTLLALSAPTAVPRDSTLAERLGSSWPHGSHHIWKVATVECCRAVRGLHFCELLLHVAPSSGRLVLIGDVTPCEDDADGIELSECDSEPVEVWRSPAELRSSFCMETMRQVLHQMTEEEADWSLRTAICALFSSAWLSESGGRLLERAKVGWHAAPICTSVPIAFWQRYLCELCQPGDSSVAILRWMPLAADRALPGDLVEGMRRCGWSRLRQEQQFPLLVAVSM